MSFARKDYRVRYAQTYLGYWWSVIQPLGAAAVLYLIFQRMVNVPTEGVSYFPFVLSGLVLWNYFSYIISQSAASLVNAQHMIRKIYFPRLTLPLSRTIAGIIEPMVALLILAIAMAWHGEGNLPYLLLSPIPLLFTALAALGAGIWISALSLRYRDLQQILPLVLQILFFLTPVAYSSGMLTDVLDPQLEWVWYLNPVTGIVEWFRSILFQIPLNTFFWISPLTGLILIISGLRYFQTVERKIADIL